MIEMTATEMLRDPMIRQVLRADNVSLAQFAALLLEAAAKQNSRAVVMRKSLPIEGPQMVSVA